MSKATFLIADLHLGRKGMCEFTVSEADRLSVTQRQM
jgi:hypothetical protein